MKAVGMTPQVSLLPAKLFKRPSLSGVVFPILSIFAGLVAWELSSLWFPPIFLPSPATTFWALVELARDGSLWASIVASTFRILAGWIAGVAVGIPLGMAMGYVGAIRKLCEPYIEFFRFVPPISFVTLAVIWLGPGDASKIALIFYTTVFAMTLNAIAGTVAVPEIRLRAAAALGAGRLATLRTVIVPSVVPHLVTGARIAMGNSFLTIVSAEIVASEVGLGALIWNARNYGRTDWVFAGILTLGCLGFLYDRILRTASSAALKRFGVNF
ncbi:ABC transporter permease [Bradyrhizobium manausense]